MQKQIKLNSGNNIPILGLGTWKAKGSDAGNAVEFAILKAGFRHLDCASIYGNEKEIGISLKNIFTKNIKREEIFITSKLWNTEHNPIDIENACRKTLSDLQLDYLDLYLMHWGIAFKKGEDTEPVDKDGKAITANVAIQDTWREMENLVMKGLVKSIGVANFTTMMLVDLLAYAKIQPSMNQVELHPYNTQELLVEFCKYKNIAVTAYSPLGRPGMTKNSTLFDEKIIKDLAKKYKKTPAQIALNWGIKRDTIVIPKSITPERILENSSIFDFELTQDDSKEIDSLNKNFRFVNPINWWGIPYFT